MRPAHETPQRGERDPVINTARCFRGGHEAGRASRQAARDAARRRTKGMQINRDVDELEKALEESATREAELQVKDIL